MKNALDFWMIGLLDDWFNQPFSGSSIHQSTHPSVRPLVIRHSSLVIRH
jgi:hypothetical protein